MAKKKTQEQIDKERKQEELGNEFIRQREQRAAQLAPQGGDVLAAQKQAAKEISAKNEPLQMQERQQIATEEIIQEQGAAKQPERVSLKPAEIPLQKLPFGSSMAAIATAGGSGANIPEQLRQLPERAALLPENQRQEFLNIESKRIIEKSVLKRRLSFEEKAGVLIESVPIVSSLARKFAGNLLTTPSKKVDDIRSLIKDFDNEISFAGHLSIDNPNLAFDSLNSVETKTAELESRIQQLIIISPELRANPEEVDAIEAEILRTRQNIFNKRRTIASISAAPQ